MLGSKVGRGGGARVHPFPLITKAPTISNTNTYLHNIVFVSESGDHNKMFLSPN